MAGAALARAAVALSVPAYPGWTVLSVVATPLLILGGLICTRKPQERMGRILAYAGHVLTDREPLTPALWASRGAVSLLRDFDLVLNVGGDASDSLAEMEVSEQQVTVQRIGGAGEALSTKDAIAKCQSSAVFSRLLTATEEVARVRDWDVSGR